MDNFKQFCFKLDNIGIRPQGLAVGFFQLCNELHSAGVIQGDAIDRIKEEMAVVLAESCPKRVYREKYECLIHDYLHQAFSIGANNCQNNNPKSH